MELGRKENGLREEVQKEVEPVGGAQGLDS